MVPSYNVSFGSVTSPDAIVVDDRFLNRHATADRSNGRSKVYTTLDILKTLQTSKEISDDDYFRSLNNLRRRGHLFVPLEMEELRAYISEATVKEGQLRVGGTYSRFGHITSLLDFRSVSLFQTIRIGSCGQSGL